MTDTNIWNQEIPVPEEVISYVDPGILEVLPSGTRIQPNGIPPSGSSYWARTAKISALNEKGEEKNYFVKVHQGELGKQTVPAFYQGMAHLHALPPPPTFFSTGLQGFFANELETNGYDQENERMKKRITEKVIPRLLRPLETGGRKITPVLVHGDLWDGNSSTDVETGRPMIFDTTPLWAHHEYELGPWFYPRNEFYGYIDDYIKHFEIAKPKEEFRDRGALYLLRFDMLSSSLYPGNLKFRIIAKETMTKLLEKYGGEV